ncbi:MAG: sulfatase-like hydrolase/transferase [bacterium]|nr:sulfatase-like hydrolase/transferase [bacterium]
MAIPLALTCAREGPPPEETPRLDFSQQNLLVVTIDTLRPDRLGSYGYREAQTPHLDRLAAEGVRFANCYAAAPLTLPSHAALFTGRYPFAVNVRNNGTYFLRDDEVTLAELFRQQGFATSATVAAYVLTSKFGLAQGFDAYDDALAADQLLRTFTSEIPAAEVYRRFRRWLDGHGTRRFFAWVHFYDPHLPYAPPGEWGERFAADPYSGEVAYVDAYVGRILAALESRGLSANTLVVAASDHGEAFGEHGEQGHGVFCYEESIRVPLIVRGSGLEAGTVVDDRVQLVDLMPTLLELYGIEPPPGIQGRSFVRLLRGEPGGEPAPVYFESLLPQEDKNWAPLTGVLAAGHKYIALPEPELYDLAADPHERHNLFRERRRTAHELDQTLRELLRSATVAAGEGRRELSGDDDRQLRSLGYVSSSSLRSQAMIDPKEGIAVDQGLKRARGTLEAGDPQGAATTLDELRSRFAEIEMPELYYLRHEVAAARADESAALAALAEGAERFPGVEQFPFKRALYLFDRERYDEVEDLSRELLARNPKYSQALILLGRVAEKRGDAARALGFYRQALEIEPQSAALRKRFAEALLRTGELAQALEVYEQLAAAGTFDDDGGELCKIAMLNSRFGRLDRAEELFRRGLAVDPRGVDYLSFALVLAGNRKPEEAVANMKIALEQYAAELTPEQTRMAQRALQEWRRGG